MHLVMTARLKNTAQTSLRPEKAVMMALAGENGQQGGVVGAGAPVLGRRVCKWEHCGTRRAWKREINVYDTFRRRILPVGTGSPVRDRDPNV